MVSSNRQHNSFCFFFFFWLRMFWKLGEKKTRKTTINAFLFSVVNRQFTIVLNTLNIFTVCKWYVAADLIVIVVADLPVTMPFVFLQYLSSRIFCNAMQNAQQKKFNFNVDRDLLVWTCKKKWIIFKRE